MTTSVKTGTYYRELRVDREAVNEQARTVSLAFSSEQPYERWFGNEILDHSAKSIRLGRVMDGGPLLVDHNPSDHVGVIEQIDLGADKVGRAVVRFGRSARADEVFRDVVDGIRRHISVGYVVHAMDCTDIGDQKRGIPATYRVTDWEPLEISFVSIPADPTVGVGRALDVPDAIPAAPVNLERVEMTAEVQPAAGRDPAQSVSEIIAIGESFARFGGDKLAAQFLRSGNMDVEAFRTQLLGEIGKQPQKSDVEVGLTDKEVRRFSFVRAIHALAHPHDRQAQAAAAFEFEASRAAAEKAGKQSRGVMVPFDVLQRDLTTSTATGTAKSGYTVATDLLAGSFIDVLRARSVLPALGATFLTGLQGNIAIPRKTTASTAYWVAENSAPTEGTMAFDQVTLTPKTLAAFVDYSRKLTLQSSLDVEMLVRNDLAASLAIEVDRAGINGSGSSNEPTGVLNTSGIGSVAIGTNGGAPTWASVVNLMKAVDVANALQGNLKFLTNPAVKAKLMQTPKQSSGVEGNFILPADGASLIGYPFVTTTNVPSTLDKGSSTGVCSAMIFGNWADLLMGMWSSIDLMADPYTGSSAGTVRVVAFVDTDVAVRRAESFAAVKDYTTT